MSGKTRATKKPSPPLTTPEESIALGVEPFALAEAEPPARRPLLLRYPLGKNPLFHGVNHVLR
jgi:hypothetical protein